MIALILLSIPMPVAELAISCDVRVVSMGQRLPIIRKLLRNKGSAPILVVQPNDGCEWHWRTPYIGWASKLVGDNSPWPARSPKLATGARCGNIDPLSDKDLLDLQPDKSVEIRGGDYYLWTLLKKPGRYRVVFYYSHVTKGNQFSRSAFGNSQIANRLLASESYQLKSNEITITVKPKRA